MKKWLKIVISAAIVIVIIAAYAVYWNFFNIQGIDGQELLNKVSSPDGRYTICVYLNNGGATTDYAVLCSVIDNQTGREKNIYWNYHCDDAEVEWNDEDTVTINGIELDVKKDTYDFRYE